MGAICGVFHLDGRQGTRDEIAGMSAALAHRGPDREGAWCGESVSLAHRLLLTTPESRDEIQPLVRSHPELVLVADARIDNRDELLALLDLPLERRSTDSEIILAAYERWGEGCPERLIGDFAFAIWDARGRSLFCARDPMGVKPLYYHRGDRLFAFASELKSLFTLGAVAPVIDPEQVALFVDWSHDDRERTMYRDMLRLPAAHTLTVSPQRATLRRYWSPDTSREIRYATDEEYVEAFSELFRQAVSARLRSSHPVGATLSGGLDSSSIVCTGRQLRSGATTPLHTFSVIFPDLPERELRLIDERAFADSVAQLSGVQPHYIRGDHLSPLRDVRRILWHLDEPYSTPNLYLHWAMFESANANGVRVLLDGFDGDTVVSHGFGRLTGLTRSAKWDTLEAEVRAFSSHHGKSPALALSEYVLPHLAEMARSGRFLSWFGAASELARRFGLSRSRLAVEYGVKPLLPAAAHAWSRPTVEQTILSERLAKSLARRTRNAAIAEARRPAQSERAVHAEGILQPLYQLALEIADKCAAAFGIEARYPFFDRRLIEFCIGIPAEQKFAGGWPRLLLRRSMNGILPPMIQWRSSKANLSPNFQRQFRRVDAAAGERFDDDVLAPYLRTDRLRDLFARYRAASDHTGWNRQALMLFRTAVLETWLHELSDRSPRPRPDLRAHSSVAA